MGSFVKCQGHYTSHAQYYTSNLCNSRYFPYIYLLFSAIYHDHWKNIDEMYIENIDCFIIKIYLSSTAKKNVEAGTQLEIAEANVAEVYLRAIPCTLRTKVSLKSNELVGLY